MFKSINMRLGSFGLLLVILLGIGCKSTEQSMQADVVIVGGGTGGTAAAIQSARSGAKTILVCESPWLGGMLTAAGVGCTDGNHMLPSGIWNEFREAAYTHYGTRNLATGWVSNFNIEPHVGDSIFKAMAKAEANLTVLYTHSFNSVEMKSPVGEQKAIEAVLVKANNADDIKKLTAKVYIDATELGDLLAAAGCRYDVGLEPEDVSGEIGYGVSGSYGVIQDLTYAAVLKDYGAGANKTIPKPENYNDAEFACSNNEDCNDSTKLYSKVDAQKMLDYGRMPNNKFMINWPSNGNDYFTDIIHRNAEERALALDSAKQKTLRFIYYIQTKLNKPHIGLADDEFDTPDKLPYIAYHRESRRLQGQVRFSSSDMIKPGTVSQLYRTGIGVGDYPIDHHHRMYPGPQPELTFVPVPSYSVPAGATVPLDVNNLLVCDKSISVSNIMNGTTRLQPVVLLVGQAVGIMAATAAKSDQPVQALSVRNVQAQLLEAKAFIMPYADVLPTDTAWEAIQKVGASGLMMGLGKTEGWANRTYFYPDSTLKVDSLQQWVQAFGFTPKTDVKSPANTLVTLSFLEKMFLESNEEAETTNPDKASPLSRKQIAVWLHQHVKPFDKAVNWRGDWVRSN